MTTTLVQIRDINTGSLVHKFASQQISPDAGHFQQDNLAKKLMDRYSCDPRDTYVSIVEITEDGANALRKFQL